MLLSQWDSKSIWCIVKVNYRFVSQPRLKPDKIDIMSRAIGTAFFISNSKFITANHCLNNNLLKPDEGFKYFKYILVSADGSIIQDYKIIVDKPEYDLTIGLLNDSNNSVYVWELSSDYNIGDTVYNIGYPGKMTYAQSIFKIDIKDDIVVKDTIKLHISTNTGEIVNDSNITINMDGLKLENINVIVLNYFMTFGFSGCPVILLNNNKVVGFASFGNYAVINDKFLIENDIYPGVGMVIRTKDFIQYLY